MNLRQLRLFLSVCETKSVTQTGHRFYLSQPAVSKTISQLEQELGLNLFDRVRGQLVLNRDGQAFRQQAQQLVQAHQDLADFKQTRHQQAPIALGLSLTIGTQALIACFSELMLA